MSDKKIVTEIQDLGITEPGSVPVSVTESGGVVFCTHQDLREIKLRWMSARVPLAFDGQNRSLLQRVAILEHADGLMGGHPLTVAALLLLSDRNPGAVEIGDPALKRLDLVMRKPGRRRVASDMDL